MLCHEFDHRFHSILDQRGRPELDEALSKHASVCNDCAERLAIQGAILSNWTAIGTPALRSDFAANVVQQAKVRPSIPSVSLARSQSSPRWAWVAVAATATAAACLLWFSPAWRSQPAGLAERGHDRPAKEQAATLALSQSQPSAKLQSSPVEIQPRTDIPAPQSDPRGYEEQIRQWVHTLPEAVERMEEVDLLLVEEYAPGLRSLRTSLSLALDTLRRSLPGHREGQKLEGAWRNLPAAAPV